MHNLPFASPCTRIARLTLSALVLALSALPAAAQAWIASQRLGDTMYFLFESPARIEAYDLASQQWQDPVTLRDTPSAFLISGDDLFVAFGEILYRYDLDGSQEKHITNLPFPVLKILADDNLLFVHYIENNYTHLNSYSRTTLASLDSQSSHLEDPAIIPGSKKIIGRYNNDTLSVTYDEMGEFSSATSSSDSTSTGNLYSPKRIFLWPDGSRLAEESGILRETDRLSILDSYNIPIQDIDFYGDSIPIVLLKDGQLRSYSKAYQETGRLTPDTPPKSIFINGETIHLFYPDNTTYNGIRVEDLPVSLLNPDNPSEGFQADGIPFEVEKVLMTAESQLYFLSRRYNALFQFNLTSRTWEETIHLKGSPVDITYSDSDKRIYIAYSRGLLTYVDTQAGGINATEQEFLKEDVIFAGLLACGEHLVAVQSESSSTYSQKFASYDHRGVKIHDSNVRFQLNTAIWNPQFRRIHKGMGYIELDEYGRFGEYRSGSQEELIQISPDGTKMIIDEGNIHDTVSQNLLARIPRPLVDAAWIGDDIYALERNKLQIWQAPTQAPGQVIEFKGNAARVFATPAGELAIVIQGRNGIPRIYLLNDDLSPARTVPLPVPQLEVVGRSASFVDLAWQFQSEGNTTRVERRLAGETDWSVLATLKAGSTAYHDPEVSEGRIYQYRIRFVGTGISSSYSPIVQADLRYPKLETGPGEVNNTSYSQYCFVDNSGIVNYLNYSSATLSRWNPSTQNWITDFKLSGVTDRAIFDPYHNQLLVAYQDGRLNRIDLSTAPFTESPLADVNESITQILPTPKFLAVVHGSQLDLFSAQDGQLIDLLYFPYNQGIYRMIYSVTDECFFYVTSNYNTTLYTLPVSREGFIMGPGRTATPDHNTFNTMVLSPDQDEMLSSNGQIFNMESLQPVRTLPADASSLSSQLWLRSGIYGIYQNQVIHLPEPYNQIGEKYPYIGNLRALLADSHGRLFLITSASSYTLPEITTLSTDLKELAPEIFGPPSLSAVDAETDSVTLGWPDIVGESEYRIERRPEGSDWSVLATLPADETYWTDEDVVLGHSYQYRLTAVSGDERETQSNVISVGLLPPSRVTSVTATATSYEEVLLQWDDVDNEYGYQVYVFDDLNAWMLVGDPWRDATEYTVKNLDPGTEYRFRIVALSAIQNSPPSAEVLVATPMPAPVQATWINAYAFGPFEIRLSWDPQWSTSSYLIERAIPGTGPMDWEEVTTVSHDSRSYVAWSDVSVTPETTYRYRVISQNEYASAEPSEIIEVTTPAVKPVTQPLLTLTQLSGSAVSIDWTRDSNAESYLVYRRESGASEWILVDELGRDAGKIVDTVPDSDLVYEYQVVARNSLGDSEQVVEYSFAFDEVITVFSDGFEEGFPSNRWMEYGSYNSPGASGSQNFMYFNGSKRRLSSNLLRLDYPGLLRFQFRSGSDDPDDDTWSILYDTSSITVEITTDTGQNSVLESIDPTDPKFRQWRVLEVEIPREFVGRNIQISWIHRSYNYYSSPWGLDNVVLYYVLPEIPPPPQRVLAGIDQGGTVNAFWIPVAEAESYRIERKLNDGDWEFLTVQDADSCNFTDSDIVAEGTYAYRVFSVNLAGISETATLSEDMQITPDIAAARSAGQEDVVSNPAAFGLYTPDELDSAYLAGISFVTQHPRDFGLYTSADIQNAFLDGQDSVLADPSQFGLFASQVNHQHFYIMGESLVEVSGDLTTARWTLFKSDDLLNWEPYQAEVMFVSEDKSAAFFQLRPEPTD